MARRKLQKRAFHEIDRGMLGGMLFGARKQRRLTQEDVARAIERDRPWLSDVETGKITHVSDDDLEALGSALQLSPDELVRARDRTTTRTYGAASATAAQRRLCQTCGRANASDASFCSNCGTRIPSEITCPDCARQNPAGANFCNSCGRQLGNDIAV